MSSATPFGFPDSDFRSVDPAGLHNESGDDAIRGTNDDAAVSRLSAVQGGYIRDPYIENFVKRRQRQRRPPVINRGTYLRSKTIDTFVEQFLKSDTGSGKHGRKQIVVLGAGSDTRWFLLKELGLQPDKYIEVDFPEVTMQKIRTIKTSKAMSALLDADHALVTASGGTELISSSFHVLPLDLRDPDALGKLAKHLDPTAATMFLSECCLVYLEPEVAKRLIGWAAEATEGPAMFLTYEMVNPGDAFGVTMVRNLKMRGIQLPGLDAYPTVDSQKTRYQAQGWDEGHVLDINAVWANVSPDERDRLQKLEVFDEIEEWELLSAHYCLSWGLKSSKDGQCKIHISLR
ncbi:S-adenosyl-L-methionine-dependent methyltransferase [Phlyctochytrium arcticum]|nr:S-adenosyl-L-methionine-dependent methyltransferase [Phlyctochytrium arcticum]